MRSQFFCAKKVPGSAFNIYYKLYILYGVVFGPIIGPDYNGLVSVACYKLLPCTLDTHLRVNLTEYLMCIADQCICIALHT